MENLHKVNGADRSRADPSHVSSSRSVPICQISKFGALYSKIESIYMQTKTRETVREMNALEREINYEQPRLGNNGRDYHTLMCYIDLWKKRPIGCGPMGVEPIVDGAPDSKPPGK